jgi:hypothetical protein
MTQEKKTAVQEQNVTGSYTQLQNMTEVSSAHTMNIRGVIQNIPDWCRHLYSSCGSANHRYMIGLPCIVSQCAKLYLVGWKWAVFTRVYLESCTWPVAIFTMDQSQCASNFVQSWETYYRDPHNDSTGFLGLNLESYAGVSMACPVQDRSHISWRWLTQREAYKLHNSWNCCTNSRARPLGSTLDHSRHCWGGGNWLWDMPTGSNERIRHALCWIQICAQDPDSWPEAAASRRLHWTSSARFRRWNRLVQRHHWWW